MGLLAHTLKHDRCVTEMIWRWIHDAGGSIAISVLEFKFEEHFGYAPMWSRDEDEIKKLGLLNNAFRVENGEVSLLEGNRYVAA